MQNKYYQDVISQIYDSKTDEQDELSGKIQRLTEQLNNIKKSNHENKKIDALKKEVKLLSDEMLNKINIASSIVKLVKTDKATELQKKKMVLLLLKKMYKDLYRES